MILVIDNYDSFVFNIARYLRELGETAQVVRNDAITVAAVGALAPKAVVISPGPCAPDQAGVSLGIVEALSGKIPILGVCLGHQCIGQVFGGRIARAKRPLHGRASPVTHDGTGLFEGLPAPLTVGRYHSLVVELDNDLLTQPSPPVEERALISPPPPGGRGRGRWAAPLEIAARSAEGEIMALRHRDHPTFGVQFHPESVLTQDGHRLLRNFLDLAA
jgi:para-aminobenzoate synthetase component 2